MILLRRGGVIRSQVLNSSSAGVPPAVAWASCPRHFQESNMLWCARWSRKAHFYLVGSAQVV